MRACLSIRASSMQQFTWTSASARVPSAGLTSRKNKTPVPSEGRFQASPVETSPTPKARKKIARHAHLTLHSFGGRGAQSFSISSALDALGPDCYEK